MNTDTPQSATPGASLSLFEAVCENYDVAADRVRQLKARQAALFDWDTAGRDDVLKEIQVAQARCEEIGEFLDEIRGGIVTAVRAAATARTVAV